MKQLRLKIYEILTLTIMILSWLREKACFPNLILKHRTFLTPRKYIEGFGSLEECCDCGLTHKMFLREEGIFLQPLRPKDYSYKIRMLRKSSPLYEGEVKK